MAREPLRLAGLVGIARSGVHGVVGRSAGSRLRSPDGREHLPPDVGTGSRRRAGHGCARWLVESRLLDHLAGALGVAEHATRHPRRCRGREGHERRGRQPHDHDGQPDLVPLPPESGLVDRFRVVVFPVITGSTGSDRIYDGYSDVVLDMINSRTFDGRIQLLEYVPRVLAGPLGTNTAET